MAQDKQVSTRVLVAEQHYLSCVGLRSLLTAQDNVDVVGEAQDAQTALQMVSLLQPDVMLLDLGSDSVETARTIRYQNHDIQIVALSALFLPELFDALNDAGVIGYGLKDIDAISLCTAISAARRGDVWIDSRITCRLRFSCECVSEATDNTYFISGSTAAPGNHQGSNQTFSERELDILRMIASGITNREIAGRLFVSVSTVKLCVRRILDKLDVEDRTGAAVVATKRKLI